MTEPEAAPVAALRALTVADSGQGLAEYGLILGLIAVVCVVAVAFLSGHIRSLLSSVGTSI
ncbi:MAG: Flp family type IVb pilin [Candidatus Eremiobacteraeota bacterium]|nr:Flp family type IVb pilin [Candidatus Eremiobacteraeota bacterium]MBV8644308.1 Flp family type IVb pilin [Candidatus Eremiobacteraeota bacterium]